jgi:hypothetical protein
LGEDSSDLESNVSEITIHAKSLIVMPLYEFFKTHLQIRVNRLDDFSLIELSRLFQAMVLPQPM